MNTKIRVGVLVDAALIPCWAFEMLKAIEGGNYATIVLIVENSGAAQANRGIFTQSKIKAKSLLFDAFMKIDRMIGRPEPDAFGTEDLHHLLPSVPVIRAIPLQDASSYVFGKGDIERIKSREVDVLVKLGFGILKGDILTSAKYGVWSYHHGDPKTHRGEPAGFWEVMEAWPETGSALQILTEDPNAGDVIYSSYGLTRRFSVSWNQSHCYWKTLSFVPRALKELHQLGGDAFLAKVRRNNEHPKIYSRRHYTPPRSDELLWLACKYGFRALCRILKYQFFRDQWVLMYRLEVNGNFSSSLSTFKKIIPPRDRFWADPFVVFKNNRYYIFVEEYVYRTRKAHIAFLTMDRDGTCSMAEKVFEKPYHLSYPFIFSYADEYYMVPETGANRTIDLYKCVSFPDKWEFVKTLMSNISAFDATLWHNGGKWWLFANVCENAGTLPFDELYLYYTTDLLAGQWTPHALNPVVSDVKSARPAGRIFTHKRNVYRPSQNSSYRYGHGMKINQIVTLSESEYKEVCVVDIEPLWDKRIFACHTFNFVEGLTVVDGLQRRAKWFG
jgi:hypothetical protein